MITVDLTVAIAAFLVFCITLVLLPWLFYNYKQRDDDFYTIDDISQCPYCAFTFIDYKQDKGFKQCPRCGSYLDDIPSSSNNREG